MSGRLPAAPRLTSSALPADAPVPQAPGLTAAGSGAPQMLTLADRFDAMLERRSRRDDAAAADQAAEAGRQAGAETPGAQMEGGGDIYRSAFNRAALESGGRRIEITARTELDRIARENPADPVAFETAAASYRDGLLQGLPQNFHAIVGPSIDALALPYARGIRDQQNRAVADERLATFNAALPLRLAALERAGLAGSTRDMDREERLLVEDLVALGPRSAFTFGGVEYPADPTRAGALSLVQMAEAQGRARDVGTFAAARHMFAQSPRTEAWIAQFETKVERGEVPGLAPTQGRRIADEFRRDLAQERSARNEGQRAARAALAPRIDADRAAIADSGRPVSSITDAELVAAGYDPTTYRAEERTRVAAWQATTDLATMTDPQAATELAERFAPGTALFAADPQTALRVRDLARGRGAAIQSAELDRRVADRQAMAIGAATTATQRAATLPANWRPHVATGAAAHGVPEFLLAALIGQESRGRTGQVSPAGARGIAQVMPDTGANPGFGVPALPADAVDDPSKAIPWAAQYLSALRREFGGDWELALMAYNWGPGNVQRWVDGGRRGAVPQETRDYVRTLLPAAAGDPRQVQAAGVVTREEASAAGRAPEWADQVNARAAEEVRTAALRTRALTATPEEQQQIAAELAVTGDMAAENARAMAAVAQALEQRQQAITRDAAAYAISASPTLQGLGQRLAAGDAAALPPLLEGIAAEQERQGVPQQLRRILPKETAQAIVARVTGAASDPERLVTLGGVLAPVGDPAQRTQLVTALRAEGLPEHLAIGARLLRERGPALATRITSELATDPAKIGLDTSQRNSARTTVASTFADSDRLGGLRVAQAQATGSGAFLAVGGQERDALERISLARAAAAGGSLSSSAAREAYEQLFGGRVVVNRDSDGVLVSAPAGTDPDRLAVEAAAGARPEDAAALRAAFRNRMVWVDEGAGRFALYARGGAAPLQGSDGQPIVATPEQALAAAPPDAPAGTYLREQQRGQQRAGQRMGREAREFEQQRRTP
jgi:soluble lytic murein transglycosylase-like protein